ncbi:MAG TPA: hypothetical protein VHE35_32755 [Kofleriaceae bacterium]|nr:hypothetical protein [Kofleriaceae bacterium]
MTHLARALAVGACVALSAACGATKKRASPPPADAGPASAPLARPPTLVAAPAQPPAADDRRGAELLARLVEHADAICACTDPPCADAAGQRLTAWMKANESRYRDYRPDDAVARQSAEIAARVARCTHAGPDAATP